MTETDDDCEICGGVCNLIDFWDEDWDADDEDVPPVPDEPCS